jgi:hypothetical protein
MIVWAIFLIFGPLVIVALATGYAWPQTAPFRAAFVATASMSIGAAMVVYLVVSAIVASRPMLAKVAVAFALVAVTTRVGVFVASAMPVIKAEQLRARLVATRGASIRRQLRRDRTAISILPAPMIDPKAQAYDLLFAGQPQIGFLVSMIRAYYGIPTDARLDIVPTQPSGYCLRAVSVPWVGIQSCEQLPDRS